MIKVENLDVHFEYVAPENSSFRVRLKNRILKESHSYPKSVKALNDINLHFQDGDRVGLIGHNGCGKTTLLRVLAGVLMPTAGVVKVEGQVNSVFDPGLGMDLESSGFDNIKIRLMLMEFPVSEINSKVKEIAEFSELGVALHRPIKTYSAGMKVKLSFAIATSISPENLIIDEWLSAGDAEFVQKALTRMKWIVDQCRVLVVASHSQDVIENWCNKVVWLDNGYVKKKGHPKKIFREYLEFYKK